MRVLKKGGKAKKKKKKKGRSYSDLDAAEKQVYKRGLAAYMSSETDRKYLNMLGLWLG